MSQSGAAINLRRVMLGGYSDANLEDERVLGAASFAVNLIGESESPPGAYDFSHSLISLKEQKQGLHSIGGDKLQVRVVKARQQVVAGINYDLTIEAEIGGKCLGAFEVTVWDQFGDLEVTNWGEQVPCSAKLEKLEEDEV